MINLPITKNTVTQYLDELNEVFEDSQGGMMDKLAEDLSENYIEKYIPQWNPNLFESGENPKNWFRHMEDGMSAIELLYTGFTELSEYMYVFYEMGGYSDSRKTSLKRDYAYYQETGEDLYHGSYPKASSFEGHHYVKYGTEEYSKSMNKNVARYLNQILELRRVYGETTQSKLI